MRKYCRSWGAVVVSSGLCLLGATLNAKTFSEKDADVFLECGGNELCSASEWWMGNFDGDLFTDLFVPVVLNFGYVVFGDNYPNGGSTPLFRNTRIGRTGVEYPLHAGIGDITGDGKDETFFLLNKRVYGTFGHAAPQAFLSSPIDLTIENPSEFSFLSSFAFGDVNGDGIKDLLIYDHEAYVVFGSTSFGIISSTISVTDTSHCLRISGVYSSGSVASGDVDGDGYDDIVLGDVLRIEGTRTNAGAVYVIRGNPSLASLGDLNVSSADWTIVGTSGAKLDIVFVADFSGDGKADLGLKKDQLPILLSGAGVVSMGPQIDLAPGQSNSLTPSGFTGPLVGDWHWGVPGDFDGDGRPDLSVAHYVLPTIGYDIGLILSHSFPAGASLPEVIPPGSLHFTNSTGKFVLGDLNGDGKSDLVYPSDTYPLVNVFYGYRPLENPSLVIQSRDSNQARVHLLFGVDGDVSEMKITGEVMDPAPGVWMPYQSKIDVTLTSSVGDKTITVVFRTSGGHESDPVSAQIPLAFDEGGSSVVTNLVRAGGTARLEARLETAGRLKASVYSREGRLLRTLIDQDVDSGVHVFDWDGADNEGRRLAPGVYTVIVDRGGQIDRRRILVK
jgi:hypothetical protein